MHTVAGGAEGWVRLEASLQSGAGAGTEWARGKGWGRDAEGAGQGPKAPAGHGEAVSQKVH